MNAIVIVCTAAVILAAAAFLALELLRRTPQGKLDIPVAFARKLFNAAGMDSSEPLPTLRAGFVKKALRFHGKLPPMVRIRGTTVPADDHEIPVRIYTPSEQVPRPVVLYFHGGGIVLGSIGTHENVCRHIARESDRLVISVEYRLAPEHAFPAALEDCFAVLLWVSRNAPLVGGRVDDIAVAGDSAGGTLAAALCLLTRDRGGPRISGQVFILDSSEMAWFRAQYLPDSRDYLNPYASPLLAESLRGVPPALILTAEFDVLRDEGRSFADRLRDAGVPVVYSCTPGVPHGYLSGTRFLKRRTRHDFGLIAGFLRGLAGERLARGQPTG